MKSLLSTMTATISTAIAFSVSLTATAAPNCPPPYQEICKQLIRTLEDNNDGKHFYTWDGTHLTINGNFALYDSINHSSTDHRTGNVNATAKELAFGKDYFPHLLNQMVAASQGGQRVYLHLFYGWGLDAYTVAGVSNTPIASPSMMAQPMAVPTPMPQQPIAAPSPAPAAIPNMVPQPMAVPTPMPQQPAAAPSPAPAAIPNMVPQPMAVPTPMPQQPVAAPSPAPAAIPNMVPQPMAVPTPMPQQPVAAPSPAPSAIPNMVPQPMVVPPPMPQQLVAAPNPAPAAIPNMVPQPMAVPTPMPQQPIAAPSPAPAAIPNIVPQPMAVPTPMPQQPAAAPSPAPSAIPNMVPQPMAVPTPMPQQPAAAPSPAPTAIPNMVPQPMNQPQTISVTHNVSNANGLVVDKTTVNAHFVTDTAGNHLDQESRAYLFDNNNDVWSCMVAGLGTRQTASENGEIVTMGHAETLEFRSTHIAHIPANHPMHPGCLISVQQ